MAKEQQWGGGGNSFGGDGILGWLRCDARRRGRQADSIYIHSHLNEQID